MNRIGIVICLLCFGLTGFAQKQGIQFFKGSFQEALAQAKKENKLIFVDAYTTWCGPCKIMSRKVFTDQKVGEFYNEKFINLKLDQERGEGPQFARKYRVRAYPTLLYIDGDGNLVHQKLGVSYAKDFIALGETALDKSPSGD